MVLGQIKNSKNLNGFIYYKSLETIPVFNYWKLQKTNDLRYLIANVDINSLPEKYDKDELNNAYYEFNLNINNVNFELQKAYFKVLSLMYDYQSEKTTRQKVDDSFNVYCKILDKYFKNYEYDNEIFDTAIEFRNYLLKTVAITDNELYFYGRINVLNYNAIKAESKGSWDLYNDITAIKSYINIDIDEFKCSMSKFIHLKKLANKAYFDKKKQPKF